MANDWTIEANKPEKSEDYEWRLPANDQEHVEQTVAPGDLLIKPEDISLKPTNSPKQSGIQHGLDDWTVESGIDSSWYILGEVVQED
jgi:hypothetical protein